MRERIVTVLLAAGALFLFYTVLLPKPTSGQDRRSQPLSTDADADGELALWRWLQADQVPVSSLRDRYDHLLPQHGEPISTGNVLITVLPHEAPIHREEYAALRHWLHAGNTLLVLAALDDTPLWSLGIENRMLPELTELTGMTFSVIPESRGAARKFGATDFWLEPRGTHPLLQQVATVQATSLLPSSSWRAHPNGTLPLILLQRQDTQAPALWLLRSGEGQVIVSSFASVFTNGQVDRSDNARLLSNILSWTRSGAGRVIFDDVHQGLTDAYDPHAFFADPRLHRTLGWAVLLWLAFVLGPLPLRSTYSLWKPVDELALVDASGRFYSAAVAPLEAAHRLFENFFNRLRRRLRLPENGAPLWEWLQAQSQISAQQRAQLQTLFEKVSAGEQVKLTRLHSLLSEIQGKIA